MKQPLIYVQRYRNGGILAAGYKNLDPAPAESRRDAVAEIDFEGAVRARRFNRDIQKTAVNGFNLDTEAELAGLDGGVAEAMTAMALHTVQSRVVLFGELARCGTAAEAGEAFTRWVGHRMEEFTADQARLMEAWFTAVTRTAAVATEALADTNGASAGSRKTAA